MLPTDIGKIPVYCHMTNDVGECGGGGWTLVMKIDGNKVHMTSLKDLKCALDKRRMSKRCRCSDAC